MIWSLELDEMRMRIEMEVKCQLNNIMGKTLYTLIERNLEMVME